VSGFFYPTRNAILPDIVSTNELGTANALSAGTWSIMLALGAAVGGLVAGQWGIYPAFVIDALTFLLSAYFINRISYKPNLSLTQSSSSLRTSHKQYIEGLRYITQHVNVMLIALHKGAFALIVGGAFQVIQVTLAEQVYVIGDGGGTSLGLFYAVAGVGTGIGPIFLRRFTGDRNRPLQIAIAISYAVAALGLIIFAPLIGFGLVLLGTFFRAFGGGVNWVFSTQLLLQNVSEDVRGRVFSTEFAIFTLASAVGAAVGGWIIDNTSITLSAMIWIMSGLILIPGGLWTAWIIIRRVSPVASLEGIPNTIIATGSNTASHVDPNE
jgi:predicted MFS family arabinose efflux permease